MTRARGAGSGPILPPPRLPAPGTFKAALPEPHPTPQQPRPRRRPPTSRRYDLALAVAGAPAPPDYQAPAAYRDESGRETYAAPRSPDPGADPESDDQAMPAERGYVAPAGLAARPPPGAPTVRPSTKRKHVPPPVLDELLESTADSLLLVAEPDGSTAFDVAIRDDVFDELACRIAVRDRHVTATFRVRDANLRRLLAAETGRLRVQLAERGLIVDEIIVAEE